MLSESVHEKKHQGAKTTAGREFDRRPRVKRNKLQNGNETGTYRRQAKPSAQSVLELLEAVLKGRVVARLVDVKLWAIDATKQEQLSLVLEVAGIREGTAAFMYQMVHSL